MELAVWLSLLFLVWATVVGLLFLGARGLRLWRTFKAFSGPLEETTKQLNDAAERLNVSSERASASSPRLQASLERLRRSLAELAVLRAAIQDVQDLVGRLAFFYPSK